MTIIHTAYRFDPLRFHTLLEEKIIDQGALRLDRLQRWAVELAANASDVMLHVLANMRYGEEWLDSSDDSVSKSDFWYMIVLSQACSPNPSLSNRQRVSWRVLEQVLPVLDWPRPQIDLLIRGEWLHTLVESSGNVLFIDEFTTVDQFGGWLRLSDAQSLLSHLQVNQKQFLSPPSEFIEALSDFAKLWSQSPVEMINKAYADATEMLQTAIDHYEALFVILD
jgi:hypothetical protein